MTSVELFFAYRFVDYVEPLELEESEMFVMETMDVKWHGIYKGEDEEKYYLELLYFQPTQRLHTEEHHFWIKNHKVLRNFRKATDEEFEELERFMLFYNKGRTMNEFKGGD
ncbi:hypothetical protein IAW_05725 [Bacillus cereus str. Schrouff]|nr:hypothetical protein [Bacillus cereus]EOO04908.1 hypothetical protein IAW_05725 [Bacillus cereus str. Schrouff]EOO81554.1 hypothetical protein IGY_05780 [Bacillus cereus K-5975c]